MRWTSKPKNSGPSRSAPMHAKAPPPSWKNALRASPDPNIGDRLSAWADERRPLHSKPHSEAGDLGARELDELLRRTRAVRPAEDCPRDGGGDREGRERREAPHPRIRHARTRNEVSESLSPACDGRKSEADRAEIERLHDVADQCAAHSNPSAVRAHHAKADETFAERRPEHRFRDDAIQHDGRTDRRPERGVHGPAGAARAVVQSAQRGQNAERDEKACPENIKDQSGHA